jgi:hypothetical protein
VTELSFSQGDETWRKLRRRALSDLYWFNQVVLDAPNKFPFEEKTHRLPLLFAERKTGVADIDNAPNMLLMWPRECGKSTCVTVGRSIQNACRDPNSTRLIANEKQGTAEDFIHSIKHHFETNPLLRALFPEVIPPDLNKTTWSASRATLNRDTGRPEPTFDSIGVGGTVTGKHYDEIICDDLISREAMENARSGNWTIMHKVNRWVNQLPPLLSNGAKPFPSITFIGTRWWHDDVYQHVMETMGRGEEPRRYRVRVRLSTGEVVSREVTRSGSLAVMVMSAVEDGKPVFPSIWPSERIEEVMRADPEFASCNLFNDPSNAAVRTFSDEWLRYWQYADNDKTLTYTDRAGVRQYVQIGSLYKTICVDPAAGSAEGARNAIIVLGTDMETGMHFILEAIADRSDPKDLIADIVNTAQRWDTHVVKIELAGQQKYVIQWVEREARDRGYPLAVDELRPGGRNKDLRIGGLVVPFKNGDLYVHASQTALLADEYHHYRPGAKLVDVLDALAYAVEEAPKPAGRARGMNARKRSQAQLESYYARRGFR